MCVPEHSLAVGVGGQERCPGTGSPAGEVSPPPPRPSRKGRHRTFRGQHLAQRTSLTVVCPMHHDGFCQTTQILPKSLSPRAVVPRPVLTHSLVLQGAGHV